LYELALVLRNVIRFISSCSCYYFLFFLKKKIFEKNVVMLTLYLGKNSICEVKIINIYILVMTSLYFCFERLYVLESFLNLKQQICLNNGHK
jgi:hypothetical protein